MATEPDREALQRFGSAVLRRRRELQLNQLEVQHSGGPSTSTLTKIEAGLPPTPSPRTLRKVDVGLQWVEGSAYRLLHEGIDPEPAKTRDGTRLVTVPSLPRIEGGPLRRLVEIRRELDEVIEELRAE